MNKRRKNIKNKYVYVSIILIVVAVAVVSYMIKSNNELNIFESLVKDSVVSVQKVFNTPIKSLDNMIDSFFSLKNVLKENKILKSNVEKIESLEAENIELKQELKKIKEEKILKINMFMLVLF